VNRFRLTDKFDDFYEQYIDFIKGNKNGIMVKKSVEKYKNGEESILYIAEVFHEGKGLMIGIGHTVEEIEKEVNVYLENMKNVFQVEKIDEYE